MEEKEIMSFKDEDGNKVDFEAIAKIYLEEQGYLLLSPLDEDSDDMFAFRIDVNEEGNLYSVRLLQPLNAATPIFVILSVTFIDERVLFWNARLPNDVTVSGNSIFPTWAEAKASSATPTTVYTTSS